MFGHTQFSIGPQFPTRNFDGRKLSPTSRPQSPSTPQQVTRRTTPSPLSERYLNKSYNRVPSPVSRLQPRPASGSSGVREVPKSPGLSTVGFRSRNVGPSDKSPRIDSSIKNDKERVVPRLHSPMSSASDMVRPRPLQEQCLLRSPTQPRPRPRTAVTQKDMLDSQVMVAVKEVLSRAVLERGPIYEHNIDTIMYDMRNQLRLADDGKGVGLNEKTSTETIESGKVKPLAGIVRKDLGDSVKPTQSAYKRVYSGGLQRSSSNRVIDNDPETIVFINLPDPDSSNFSYAVNQERNQSSVRNKRCDLTDVGNKYSRSVTNSENINLQTESEEDVSSYVEERVGDGQPRVSRSFTVWKESDDMKLQRYISKLINNIHNQDSPPEGIDHVVETDSAACKSFCICKVCHRNTVERAKKDLEETIRPKPKPLDNGLTSSINRTSSIRSSIGKSKPIAKDSKATTNVKILKKADNFVIDSKSAINPRSTLFIPPQTSHNMPDPETDEEAREEMYLQRRMRRSPTVKRN